MNTTIETAPVSPKARRIRRAPEIVPAAGMPTLKAALASGQFVGIKAEKLDGSPRIYCAHKPYFRHLKSGGNSAPRVQTPAQKAQVVFTEVNADAIRSISGQSRIFWITFQGKRWSLTETEYTAQKKEAAAAAENAAESLESVVTTALAECLATDSFPPDFADFADFDNAVELHNA